LSNKLEIQHNDPIMEKKWDRKLKKKKEKKKKIEKKKFFPLLLCRSKVTDIKGGNEKTNQNFKKQKKEKERKNKPKTSKKLKKERKALKIREQQTKNSSINILKVKSL
jgi:hypothetical protein